MSKQPKNSAQCNLFEWVRTAEAQARRPETPSKGSLDVDKELKAAIADDLRHAADESSKELSRAEVAARMTDFTGEEISLSTLNNWSAPSHPHSMPAKYLPAFVRATGGGQRAMETLSRHAGLFALPGREALRAEIQRFDEELKRLRTEKQRRTLFLQELERETHG